MKAASWYANSAEKENQIQRTLQRGGIKPIAQGSYSLLNIYGLILESCVEFNAY